jgi:adenylate cyclase
VHTLLESPKGLQMGGEKRKVTMMMTDLRGFTSLSERLAPERVVAVLNRYFTTMVKIIKQYDGTIDEFIGDAIFVLFGAPVWREDDAQRAVACALAMQLAMPEVNEQNQLDDLPEVEMGIGIHTGQVVLGNIGSPERMKYGVVGRHVNLTSRIQSYTTGGQIFITESTRQEVGPIVRIGKHLEVNAKGIEHPVAVSEVLGIGRPHMLFLPETTETLVPLPQPIAVRYTLIEGDQLSGGLLSARLTKLSTRSAEARFERPLTMSNNLKMHLLDAAGAELPGALYAKVVGLPTADGSDTTIRFTSMSPEIRAYLRQQRG